MPLGGTSALAWLITIGFLVAFVTPVVYITYLSMKHDSHTWTPASESNGTGSES